MTVLRGFFPGQADRVLGIADALDGAIGQVKQRRRGVSAGGLLPSVASAQMTGADFLVGMDRRRADTAGQQLEPVPAPASTTTAHGVSLSADLMKADEDPRPVAVRLLDRAIAAIAAPP